MEKQDATLNERLQEFEQKNPEIAKALEIFNVSFAQYENTLRALKPLKVYVNTSTLPPGQNG